MRLITRSDFDGLACGAILVDIGVVDCWRFAHPKDLQDGTIEVCENDVLANVPYVPGCGMWFDHHSSENERLKDLKFKGSWEVLDSAAHVVYNYYKDDYDLSKFDEMLEAVDKVDAAKLTADEVLNPSNWVLLGFIMDPRTGLGRFREFNISNYQLMEKLIEFCGTMSIEEILKDPDVKERTDLYFEHAEKYKEMVSKNSKAYGNVVVTDLRGADIIYAGNRFMIYSMFPQQNISVWVVDGRLRQNCSIAVGYSVINRTATANVGSILLSYGGGGHKQVGTCQVPYDDCDKTIAELVEKLK